MGSQRDARLTDSIICVIFLKSFDDGQEVVVGGGLANGEKSIWGYGRVNERNGKGGKLEVNGWGQANGWTEEWVKRS